MRPIPDFLTNLIAFSPGNPQTYLLYTQNMQAYLKTYEFTFQVTDDAYATCDPNRGTKSPNNPKKVCRFDLDYLGPCQKQNMYGYEKMKPCIILKLNKVRSAEFLIIITSLFNALFWIWYFQIYGWIPSNKLSDNILVKCEGKHALESEMIGPIHYYPNITVNNVT